MTDLIKQIDKQVQRALMMLRDGDRAPYLLRGAGTFFGGQTTPVQVAFSVPADGDFHGDAMSLFIEGRSVTNGVPEAAFRPVDWTTTNDLILNGIPVQSDDIGKVSGDFDLLLPEPYANASTSIGAAFSTRHGYGVFGGRMSYSAYVGKLEFLTPCFIPRGTTATLVFTPGYAFAPPADPDLDSFEYEYRISALIEGFKKVKSLLEVRP